MKIASRKRHAGSNPVRGVWYFMKKKWQGVSPAYLLTDFDCESRIVVDSSAEQCLRAIEVLDEREW